MRISLFNTFSRLIPFAYPIDFGVGTCSKSYILILKQVLFLTTNFFSIFLSEKSNGVFKSKLFN